MAEQQLENLRILAIDDDSNILDFYRSVLADVGGIDNKFEELLLEAAALSKEEIGTPVAKQHFELVEANQGELGVQLASEALERGEPFACAFVDMRMPPGIDGHETARRLRELDEHIFIIIITAYSDTEIEKLQEVVRHDLLYASKPVSPDQLHQLAFNACVSWERTHALRQLQEALEEKVRARTAEIERLSEQAQYSAFQAGLVEMSSSVIHNIGNAVGGMGGLSWKLENELKSVHTISKGLSQLRQECLGLEEVEALSPAVKAQMERHAKVIGMACDALQVIADERLQGIVQTLSESVEYIKEIITLQQSAAKQDNHAISFSMKRLVGDALIILKDRYEQHKVTVEQNIESGRDEIQLPRNQLLQLLINFLKNSLEAVVLHKEKISSEGYQGRVRITIRSGEQRGKPAIKLMVEDNGIGCRLSEQEKLFASGYTTKKQGSGLGLHSAANFVQSIDGAIRFTSPGEGKGAKVEVILPVS